MENESNYSFDKGLDYEVIKLEIEKNRQELYYTLVEKEKEL